MRRTTLFLGILGLVLALPGAAALADHESLGFGVIDAPLASGINAGGEGAEWELITTLLSGNPHTDLDFFTQGGETYVSAGTLAAGANGGGQTIHRLMTADGEVDPEFVSHHPSASCISLATGITGLQHDVEATPKGDVLFNTDWGGLADTRDAQLLLDTSDAPGRCHDNGPLFGLPNTGVPQGGLEIVDITDIENPVEIALTSHIGEAHTVNVDPKRPHIAYAVTSDSFRLVQDENDADGDGDTEEQIRDNEDPEGSPLRLDGFEIVDLSNCLDFPADATVEEKRGIDTSNEDELAFLEDQGCRPEVYRYRWPSAEWSLGTFASDLVGGCHELELYPDDRLACSNLQSTLLIDVSGAFDDNGTPDDFTDDVPVGDPLPCAVRASSSSASGTDAPVIDCVNGGTEDEPIDLSIPSWLDMGAPSLEGVELIGFVNHGGRDGGLTANNATHDPALDVAVAHESELTHSGEFVITTDERGGAVVPPDASCPVPGSQPSAGNGGMHAFRVDELYTSYPAVVGDDGTLDQEATAERARQAYATTPDGEPAIYRATPRVPALSTCTAHVFMQIPDQNRIFMGWYTQGTQVVDYIEHADGSFEFKEVAWWIPESADTWTSAVFKYEENDDGTFTYWGATGDFFLGGAGRNAVDVWKVTLPAPAQAPVEPAPPPAPETTDGGEDEPMPTTGGGLAVGALALLAAGIALAARRRRPF